MNDVLREALPGEVARRLHTRSTTNEDPLGSFVLALERPDSTPDEVVLDASLQQVTADERVARTAPSERPGAALGKALVVDEPGSDECCENVYPLTRGDSTRLEMAVDLRSTPVTVAQRTESCLESSVAGCVVRRFSSRREPPLRRRSRPRARSPRVPGTAGVAPR